MPIKRKDTQRFWSKVKKLSDEECWEWIAGKAHDGYGNFSQNGRRVAAHRVAYELTYTPIPEGYFVCHHCDNPSCVNPVHLFLGTPRDNMVDAQSKGRLVHHRGDTHANAKLTSNDVKEIRARYLLGSATQKGLAKEYGVSKALIWQVLRRLVWAWVA